MKISGISSYNYNNNNSLNKVNNKTQNVSFGRFIDENAEQELIKFAKSQDNEYDVSRALYAVDTLRETEYADVYTDDKTSSGKIRVEYNEKKMEKDGVNIDYCMRWYDDLRSKVPLLKLASHMRIVKDLAMGIRPETPTREEIERQAAEHGEAERRRQEERLSWLAF